MTQYTDWKIWNGGDRPFDAAKKVQIQRRDETRLEAEKKTALKAGGLDWYHRSKFYHSDIIAYREVIKPVRVTETHSYWALQGHPLRAFNKVMSPPREARLVYVTLHYEEGEVVHVEMGL